MELNASDALAHSALRLIYQAKKTSGCHLRAEKAVSLELNMADAY